MRLATTSHFYIFLAGQGVAVFVYIGSPNEPAHLLWVAGWLGLPYCPDDTLIQPHFEEDASGGGRLFRRPASDSQLGGQLTRCGHHRELVDGSANLIICSV